ncbi:MAG: DNA-3-methyladenine glycosylase I [Hyphomicrobiaceae bacterium]|nr:DNA-3-methyladenine glycosylase I [Hyphomicrobiaceae bacterium]
MTGERCWWCGDDPLYVAYHDHEWGRPVGDDTRLFEKMVLEGFQSGLSWITILRKREAFRDAFEGFEIERVAAFAPADVDRLVENAAIVRHRGKIVSAVNNARAVLRLRDETGKSLAAFLWAHEPPAAERPAHPTREVLCANTTAPQSVTLSRTLKKRGFSFVGPTTLYALMQAMGMVNDHVEGCACRAQVEAERAAFARPLA